MSIFSKGSSAININDEPHVNAIARHNQAVTPPKMNPLLKIVSTYKTDRENDKRDYFHPFKLAKYLPLWRLKGYTKNEKLAGVNALISILNGKEGELSVKDLKICKQGRLGNLIREWEQEEGTSLENFIAKIPKSTTSTQKIIKDPTPVTTTQRVSTGQIPTTSPQKFIEILAECYPRGRRYMLAENSTPSVDTFQISFITGGDGCCEPPSLKEQRNIFKFLKKYDVSMTSTDSEAENLFFSNKTWTATIHNDDLDNMFAELEELSKEEVNENESSYSM